MTCQHLFCAFGTFELGQSHGNIILDNLRKKMPIIFVGLEFPNFEDHLQINKSRPNHLPATIDV